MSKRNRTHTITGSFGGARLCANMLDERVTYDKQNPTQPVDQESSINQAVFQAQSKTNRALMEAIESNSVSKLKKAIEAGADLSYTEDEITPLYLAVLYKRKEMVALLLTHGADVNQKSLMGNTALHAAALGANAIKLEIAEFLLAAGADPNGQNNMLQTPLHFNTGVSKTFYIKLAKMLLKAGAHLHYIDAKGNEPLTNVDEQTKRDLVAFGLKCKIGRR